MARIKIVLSLLLSLITFLDINLLTALRSNLFSSIELIETELESIDLFSKDYYLPNAFIQSLYANNNDLDADIQTHSLYNYNSMFQITDSYNLLTSTTSLKSTRKFYPSLNNTKMNSRNPQSLDLLPKNMNPVQAVKETGTDLKIKPEIAAMFDVFDDGPESKRHYDHIDGLDGLTIGIGHWPQAEVFKLMMDMRKGEFTVQNNALEAYYNRSLEYFINNSKDWRQLLRRAKMSSGSERNLTNVIKSLNKTIFNAVFMTKYKKNCKTGKAYKCVSGPNMYRDQEWFVGSTRYIFRDSKIVQWQIDFYDRDLIQPAMEKAESAGLLKRDLKGDYIPEKLRLAALLSMTSIESSAPAWANKIVKINKEGITYLFSKNKLKWNWNLPNGLSNPTLEQLSEWRILVTLQYYCMNRKAGGGSKAKRAWRNRTRLTYERYLRDFGPKNFIIEDSNDDDGDSSQCRPNRIIYIGT